MKKAPAQHITSTINFINQNLASKQGATLKVVHSYVLCVCIVCLCINLTKQYKYYVTIIITHYVQLLCILCCY